MPLRRAYVSVAVPHARGSGFCGAQVCARRGGLAPRHRRPTRSNAHAPSMQIVDEQKLLDIRTKEIFMPALSSTMTQGVIVSWLKQPGDRIEAGDLIMTVESDKADMDVESFESGYLATILVEEGGTADVGATVALIAEKKEDIAKVQDCGLDCIVSGSGNRHDGTTAVANPEPSTMSVAAPPAPAAPTPTPSAQKPAGVKEVFMPALSSTMTSGKIDAYYFEVGDAIKSGDIVMAVESDKASMDVESFEEGILAHVVVDVGEEASVGDAVAYLASSEADVPAVQAWASSLASGGSPAPAAAPAASAPAVSAPATTATPAANISPVVNTGRIIASPLAKKRAGELSIDLSRVNGSGPGGRIVEADVVAAAASGSAVDAAAATPAKRTDGKIVATPEAKKIAKQEKIDLATVTGTGNFGRITADDVLRAAGKAPVKEIAPPAAAPTPAAAAEAKAGGADVASAMPEGAVKMTAIQMAVAQNMEASMAAPVFRVTYSIKTTAFDELYAKLKPKGVTVSVMLAKAVALTLQKHPIINAAYEKGSILYRPSVNVAMAVSLPDGGLMTPVLKECESTDLYSLSRTWKELVTGTMAKTLSRDAYSSGTFYVSNLGMFGVDSFDAILPKGAPAILAVGASKPVVALQPNGLVGVHKEMKVNITCDHRHIYGADAAAFLRDLADLLENDVTQLLM